MSKLEEVLANAIESSQGNLDKATDFVIEQMPDIVQQAMMWHSVSSFLLMCLFIAICVFWCFLINKCYENRKDHEELCFVVAIVAVFLFISSFAAATSNLAWLKIAIAPKLWLVEFAANLTK